MLFKDYHIPMIRNGSKTVTRREWADNYAGPNVGTVVAAKTDLLKPDDECDCFIRITGRREERLGDITEASARREGDYDSVEEFRDGYEDVYGDGSWDPDKVVNVVEFEYVGQQRPGDADQTKLVTDGGRDSAVIGDRETVAIDSEHGIAHDPETDCGEDHPTVGTQTLDTEEWFACRGCFGYPGTAAELRRLLVDLTHEFDARELADAGDTE